MGVSLEGGGRRHGFELNLVPFIDLLSVNITFLLVTAVWAQLGDLPLERPVGAAAATGDAEPPITMILAAQGITVLREGADRAALPARVGLPWEDAEAELARRVRPGERRVNLCVADDLPYAAMIRALDLTRARGLDEPALCEVR